MAGWLVGWFAGWLVGRSKSIRPLANAVAWLGRLIGCLVGKSAASAALDLASCIFHLVSRASGRVGWLVGWSKSIRPLANAVAWLGWLIGCLVGKSAASAALDLASCIFHLVSRVSVLRPSHRMMRRSGVFRPRLTEVDIHCRWVFVVQRDPEDEVVLEILQRVEAFLSK